MPSSVSATTPTQPFPWCVCTSRPAGRRACSEFTSTGKCRNSACVCMGGGLIGRKFWQWNIYIHPSSCPCLWSKYLRTITYDFDRPDWTTGKWYTQERNILQLPPSITTYTAPGDCDLLVARGNSRRIFITPPSRYSIMSVKSLFLTIRGVEGGQISCGMQKRNIHVILAHALNFQTCFYNRSNFYVLAIIYVWLYLHVVMVSNYYGLTTNNGSSARYVVL